MSAESSWEARPKGGWEEFQAARRRFTDLLWADHQLNQVTAVVRSERIARREVVTADCQVWDATD